MGHLCGTDIHPTYLSVVIWVDIKVPDLEIKPSDESIKIGKKSGLMSMP